MPSLMCGKWGPEQASPGEADQEVPDRSRIEHAGIVYGPERRHGRSVAQSELLRQRSQLGRRLAGFGQGTIPVFQ